MSDNKIELLCIGNAMVDVFAPADSAWLKGLDNGTSAAYFPGTGWAYVKRPAWR